MDINELVVTFGIGFCSAFVPLLFIAHRAASKRLRQDSSGYMLMSMISRGALQKLESGDIEGAKHELCSAVANFYHNFTGSSAHPQLLNEAITSERRQIEGLAQTSAVLADALSRKPDEKDIA